MPLQLHIPRQAQDALNLHLELGEALFILGANGSGKSALVHRFYSAATDQVPQIRRIAAHRANHFVGDIASASLQDRIGNRQAMHDAELRPQSRYRDDYWHMRASVPVSDLIDAVNHRAREIAAATDLQLVEEVARLRAITSPLEVLNRMFALANMTVQISLASDGQAMASRSGGPAYSITRLSDGERNALLLACSVLSAPSGALLLIDEPERHLHPAIVNPLLAQLLGARTDLICVISTHDISLAASAPGTDCLLIRGCEFQGDYVQAWDCDLTRGNALPEDLRKDILGGRRKMLFVEGTGTSLDQPLYALLFPGVSVVSKGDCSDVERAVSGIRGSTDLHWLQAWGIVDGDGQSVEESAAKEAIGIIPTPCYAVESLYYCSHIQRLVADARVAVLGGDADGMIATARDAALAAFLRGTSYLSEVVVSRRIREQMKRATPGRKVIRTRDRVSVDIDVREQIARAEDEIGQAIADRDVDRLIRVYKVKGTSALDAIANALGFGTPREYETAVLTVLRSNPAGVATLRTLLGNAPAMINS